eukprot:Opistho-2@67074
MNAGSTAYEEFMSRYAKQKTDAIKQKNVFYQQGSSKAKRPVFYYVARRLFSDSADHELLIYYILVTLRPCVNKPFDLVLDMTLFGREHEPRPDWLQRLFTVAPPDSMKNLATVYVLNANPWLHQFSKRISRILAEAKAEKKFVFVDGLAKLGEFIAPNELHLPASTVSMEDGAKVYQNIMRLHANRGGRGAVTVRVGAEAIFITEAEKQKVFGVQAFVSDVFRAEDLEDAFRGADDAMHIKVEGGASDVVLSGPEMEALLGAVKTTLARGRLAKQQQQAVTSRKLRPSDVPGTMLNMALLNLGSGDPSLRLAAYNLLYALTGTFGFDIEGQLLEAKGLCIPSNNTSFIIKISEKLAANEPH